MLDFSPEKMLFIFVLIVIVLGPERLPEISRKMGRVVGELRKVSGGFQAEMKKAMHEVTDSSVGSGPSSGGDGDVPSGSPDVSAASTTSNDEASGH